MSTLSMTSQVRRQTIEAVITRADGTVEHLGVIAYYHKNPLKRWAWRLSRRFSRLVKGV